MIIRNPYDRDDLNIGKKDRVLEVGSGHNPTYRADVIVEQYMETNYHRILSMQTEKYCRLRIRSLIM